MHRIIRSLMRMRSVAVLMEMTPSIDENDFSGDEVATNQKGDCVCNVLWLPVTLERYRVRETLEVTFVLARGWQNQSRGDGIDGNIGRELQRHHSRHGCEQMLAQDVSDMRPVIAL